MEVIDLIQADFPSMRSLDCPIEDGLRRLYIGRGFTLHQLHALIQRVRHEVALTQASMIVVDGMLAMFLDEQIKRFEARSILRHCMASLEEVGRNCPIVLLDGKTMSPCINNSSIRCGLMFAID